MYVESLKWGEIFAVPIHNIITGKQIMHTKIFVAPQQIRYQQAIP